MSEDLKKKVDEARKIVEKLGLQEPYKSGAFGAVLTRLLLEEKVVESLKKYKPTEGAKTVVREKAKYRKTSPASYLFRLINETGFFKEKIVRTTPEIVEGIWLKFRKRVRAAHASRDFFPIVKNGELKNDFISSCQEYPKGMYIWFLPDTPKEKVENYKKKYQGNDKAINIQT